jgi:Flp pilus assembly protein CpaB
MKIATLTALALTAGLSAAWAQDVIITPQQDTVIREYVQKKPLASISVPGVELNIGSTLPETVEVHSFQDVPDMQYRYVVVDNRTVLVEPQTRRIVKIYD